MDKYRKILFSAVARLLRPLVRLMLRNGLSHSEFVEISKRVYVSVAETEPEFQVGNRKQSVSRISVLTGLNRKEVAKVQDLPPVGEFEVTSHNRAAQVINGWLRDTDFLVDDEPIDLSEEGTDASFTKLVKKYSGDMTVRAVKDELLRLGAVRVLEDGRLRLCAKAYIPQNSNVQKLQMLGESTADLLSTLDHNLQNSLDESRLQLTLAYDNLPKEALEAFQKLSEEHAHNTLMVLNRWLSQQDRDVNPLAKGNQRFRAGLGIYYFEAPYEEGNKDD